MKTIEKLELYDIHSVWHTPFWQTKIFMISVAAIGVGVVVLLCYWVYKNYFRKKPVAVPVWEQALLEMKVLQEKKYETKEDGKKFYFQVTDILKRYLESRYNYNLHGKTDEELVCYLDQQDTLPDLKNGLKDITQGCIYIKFANQEAMQEQILSHLEMGIKLITMTIPNEQ